MYCSLCLCDTFEKNDHFLKLATIFRFCGSVAGAWFATISLLQSEAGAHDKHPDFDGAGEIISFALPVSESYESKIFESVHAYQQVNSP